MNKPKVIVVGDGGHAKVVIDILTEMNSYEILGVTSMNNKIDSFFGFPVLGNDEILEEYYKKGVKNIAIGIGGFTNNKLRKKVYTKLQTKGFNIVNIIHPNTIISKSVKLGKGVVVFPGIIINTQVSIGNNTIIATGSSIDHETKIEDHCLISAGVTIGANVTIGEGTLCALGSKIISGVSIGSDVLVAAGAVVVNNIDANSEVFGIPAKMIK